MTLGEEEILRLNEEGIYLAQRKLLQIRPTHS